MDLYQEFIAISRYARYEDTLMRRELFPETVGRYAENVLAPKLGPKYDTLVRELRDAITNLEVLPSMRMLMTAGPALERDNVAGYNCAYLPVDHPVAFDEALYILMCGTGVGFSVERQYIAELPAVPSELTATEDYIKVQDSKRGWAKAMRKLVASLYAGDIPDVNYSLLRPAGARLRTFGGRASGPEPLRALVDFTIATFQGAKGRKLNSLECHKLMCKIGESVVSGGVRRSALLGLSNLSDDRMRHAKDGRWFELSPELQLSNNSVAYTEKPEFDQYLREMVSLYEGKSGERGIFNRVAAELQATSNGRREGGWDWGTNPCSEIILRPHQFCNLTSVVVRPLDTLDTLLRKVEQAAILGTVQATFTDFAYLRPIWKRNTEEERLLGVSLSGIMDHPLLSGRNRNWMDEDGPERWLQLMKEKAVETNKHWASILKIPQAAAVTCVKPEGTVSQLTDSASGMHTRYAPYYSRRVTTDTKDPITDFMMKHGVPWEPKDGSDTQVLFSFPMKSPEGALTRNDMGAIEQLEHWLMVQTTWCEHKPSITVYYKPDEFLAVSQWIWDHFDKISGIALLPYDGGTYRQAPYEEITEQQYLERKAAMPTDIDWSTMVELDDFTVASQTLACVGSSCEVQ